MTNIRNFYPGLESYDLLDFNSNLSKFGDHCNFYNSFANQKTFSRSLLSEFNSQFKENENDMLNSISSTTNLDNFEPMIINDLKASTSDLSRSMTPLSQLSISKETDASSGVFSSAVSPQSTNSNSTADSDKVLFNSSVSTSFDGKSVCLVFKLSQLE